MPKTFYWLSIDDEFTPILDRIEQQGGRITSRSSESGIRRYAERREFLVSFPTFGPIMESGGRIDRDASVGGALFLPYQLPEGLWSTGEFHIYGTAKLHRSTGFITVTRALENLFTSLELVVDTRPTAKERFHPFAHQLFLTNIDRKLFAFPTAFRQLSDGRSFFEHGSRTTDKMLRTLELRGYFIEQ
jgi:hypothetical protein